MLEQPVKEFRKTVITYYLSKGIGTPQDLKTLLLAGLGLTISDKVNCSEEGHKSPFSFLWAVIIDLVTEALVWANRSGGKSYLGGLITWLRSGWNSGVGTKILGGSFEQSAKSYKAVNDMWDRTEMMTDFLSAPPMITKTHWKNQSNVEILTASHNSVRGPHQQKLILDEVEEMAFDIFEAALSQPQASRGIKSSTIIMSTMHKRYGVMNYLLEKYPEMGMVLFKWCVWEVLEPCVDYSCSTCPLRSYCPGKQMKEAEGHYKIEDFVKKMQQLSIKALMAEWLCRNPSREGLVYSEFEDEGDNVTEQGFDENKPVELGIDFGGTNPFAITAWQVFDKIDVQVDEVYMRDTRNGLVIAEAKARPWWKNVKKAHCDPSRPDLISEWNEALKKQDAKAVGVESEVLERVEKVRAKIKPVLGSPSLKVNRFRCPHTLFEYSSYHNPDAVQGKPVGENPVKVDDHAMDATGYYVEGKYGTKAYHFEKKAERKQKSKPISAGIGKRSW